jgi:tRNA(Arg) A34 adenosine deaminase TadA
VTVDGSHNAPVRTTVPLRTVFELPGWVPGVVTGAPTVPPGPGALAGRMGLVLELASANVHHGTGGPFASAVFDAADGRLLAVGLNIVLPSRAAVAHAEIVAIAMAGQAVGDFDLGVAGELELYASTQPCAMCLGAVPWSGVRRLVCSARDEDARAIGFDEGHKPADWQTALRRVGIDVVLDVRRQEGIDVLQAYVDAGGTIYNGSTAAEAN